MSLTQQLVNVSDQLAAKLAEARRIRSRLISATEDFVTPERLADADMDEFGIEYARMSELKAEVVALLKKRRELSQGVARER